MWKEIPGHTFLSSPNLSHSYEIPRCYPLQETGRKPPAQPT